MKIIILAAGQGTRLRPFTNYRPKCLVALNNKPLLHYQLEAIHKLNVPKKDIFIVAGYLKDKIDAPDITVLYNPRFAETNMVETLFCAEDIMAEEEDLIISYGDIIYHPNVLDKLINTTGDIVVVADLDWEKLWALRMENPLDDAETFKLNDNGFIRELGKKPQALDDVEGQYIGLIKVNAKKVKTFKNFYHNLDKTIIYDGKNFDNMFMTTFLQLLIDAKWNLTPAFINNGWLEVDTSEELAIYESLDLSNNFI
jgi:choline kinase